MPFYAHRDERRFYLLGAHLAHVAAGAAARLVHLPDGRELGDAALLAGLAHDFGKYTGFFQHYLRTGRGGPEKQHAFLSGLWAAHLAADAGLEPARRLAIFLAVIRHHQGLVDPEAYLVAPRELAGEWSELKEETALRLRRLEAQVADLQRSAPAVARSLALAARYAARLLASRGLSGPPWLTRDWTATLGGFLDGWTATYGELYRAWRGVKRRNESDLAAYFEVLSLFSALIDADKIHAARVAEASRPALPADPVGRYRAARFGSPRSPMDELRDDLYRSVVCLIDRAPPGQRLFTITAPTGTGKTLAGLAAAFRLRERLAAAGRPAPRIIYALPFTSIVDQTFDVIQRVLRDICQARDGPPSFWLLKHHHLAEPVYREPGRGDEERALDASLLLIESWQSEVVVTTFVQLLHTLIGYENRMLKKFHRLGGAVLILDEVQNIPVEYWPLVTATFRQAAARLDLRVILMTATRPEWFAPGEALELAGEAETVRRRFAALNRVTVTADSAPLTVTQAAAEFLAHHRRERAYLVVLNTIKSSIAFYQALQQAWDDRGPSLYYLSTNIVPAERERRLREIGEHLKRGEKPVVVSTQVVEAGVDMDFDEVWRDLGPVDAVVQVAGRCNRHFRAERGRVRLLHLVADGESDARERSLASYVYGPIHTRAARLLFAERPVLAEPEFFDAVADYFRLVREGKSAADSEDLLRAMARLRFDRERDEETPAVSDFALIRELPRYVDVFVCVDAAAEAVWERYRNEVAGQRDLRRRREAFLAMKRDFRRYLLSVPGALVLHRLAGDARPLCVPGYLLDEFYDAATGFKRLIDDRVLIY